MVRSPGYLRPPPQAPTFRRPCFSAPDEGEEHCGCVLTTMDDDGRSRWILDQMPPRILTRARRIPFRSSLHIGLLCLPPLHRPQATGGDGCKRWRCGSLWMPQWQDGHMLSCASSSPLSSHPRGFQRFIQGSGHADSCSSLSCFHMRIPACRSMRSQERVIECRSLPFVHI